jgi:putative ABC transport system permease protein
MLGIYGLASDTVTRRTQELGIRIALGAREAEVARMIVGQALWLAAGGAALGLIASLAVATLASLMMQRQLPFLVCLVLIGLWNLSNIVCSQGC